MAEVSLATAIEDIAYGTPERAQFETDFKSDIAAMMAGASGSLSSLCVSLTVGSRGQV